MRQAIILVGGRGTRLGALAQATPKPLLAIDGDTRFLDYLIENIARHGLEDIILLAGYLGEQVEARYEGQDVRGARLRVIREPAPAGTAGALTYARDVLDPVFLMTNGDSFFDVNYLALAKALTSDCVGALSLRRVESAARYGVVETDNGRVTAFREKDPGVTGPAMISEGFYVLRREVLSRVTALPCSIETDVFPVLSKAGLLAAQAFGGYFLDIGLPETLQEGRSDLPLATR